MAQYAPALPMDRMGTPMQQYPAPDTANARYFANTATSSVVTLSPDTSALEIGAVGGGGILVKWITTGDTTASVTSANFDHFIPGNEYRRFVVPIEKALPYPSVQGIGPTMGLYARIAWISATTATPSSVAASEF